MSILEKHVDGSTEVKAPKEEDIVKYAQLPNGGTIVLIPRPSDDPEDPLVSFLCTLVSRLLKNG